jgi:O-antigen ligase
MGLRQLNSASEALIIFAAVFSPWAFGSTQEWAIWVMNGTGLALGVLWLTKLVYRRRLAAIPVVSEVSHHQRAPTAEPVFQKLLLGAITLLLLYCLIGVWNARVVYHFWWLEYRPAISWLPHSYDQHRSWDYFWKLLGLAGLFCGVRDWLLSSRSRPGHLPVRLQRLLWILAASGLLLAVEGLAQRFSGENRLLWLVEPKVNKTPDTQFGPFAYRSNAAQYFNLLWPVLLAFWLYLKKKARQTSTTFWGRHRKKFLLLTCLLIALCPAVALSRAGLLVLLVSLFLAGIIVWIALRRVTRRLGLGILLAGIVLLGGGFLLEGDALFTRFQGLTLEYGDLSRASLFVLGRQMAADNQPFGVGPGAFSSQYQFYRRSFQDPWVAEMHNDWLEALITLGWIGLIVSLAPLFLILGRYFLPGGIRVRLPVIALFWVALGGCMIHAVVDFPFQIESILVLFTLLCSTLSTFSKGS